MTSRPNGVLGCEAVEIPERAANQELARRRRTGGWLDGAVHLEDHRPRKRPDVVEPALGALALDARLEQRRDQPRGHYHAPYGDLPVRSLDSRFFGGLTIEETAEELQVSPATVKDDWSLARGWLYRELQGEK